MDLFYIHISYPQLDIGYNNYLHNVIVSLSHCCFCKTLLLNNGIADNITNELIKNTKVNLLLTCAYFNNNEKDIFELLKIVE